MADSRLRGLRQEYPDAEGESIFGSDTLIHPAEQTPLAPFHRVAILTEAFLPKVDGVSKTAYLTVRYLQETGRDVLVFAPDNAVHCVQNTRVIPLPSFGMPVAPETRVAMPNPNIAQELHEFKPDLILLFSPALMSVSGMAMARHLNIPVIAVYQTDLIRYSQEYGMDLLSSPLKHWLRYVHNGCHLTLVPSQTTYCELQEMGFRRLRMWKRGINTERFCAEKNNYETRKFLLSGRDENDVLCIYVGRLADEKCVDMLLDTARLPGVALTIIGDGAKRHELEKLFEGTDTFFTGYLYGEKLAEAYASADIFVFPGVAETFGQVVQEAMASQLACVVVNEGAAKDLIQHGKTGIVCDVNSHTIAQAVADLRDDKTLRTQFGIEACRVVEKSPWWKIMTELEHYFREADQMNERFVHRFGKTSYHLPIPFKNLFNFDHFKR